MAPRTQEMCFPLTRASGCGNCLIHGRTAYRRCRRPAASAQMMLRNGGRRSFWRSQLGFLTRMEHGVSGKGFCGSALSGASCCPRLPGFFEHLMQPGHRPGETLSPRERGMTRLRSHHRPAAKLGREHAARALSRHCPRGWLSKWPPVLSPKLWKPVSWGLGTGWEVRAARGAGGCSSGGISFGTFQRGPWGSGCSFGPLRRGGKEISVACSSATLAPQLWCVRRVEARA